ncbi:unnamed protein product [Adineta ricciae]|uniref:Methyltransferase type 11 domain-containing protein n=1 Tax=Adineta ricciae TaxID=249248 RepID=A0A816D485_ADIRI|nr:unnamed protein product [Adineta ricciae]CAF1629458.1 unnamed protein product [Adineta ricciae]
MALISSSTISHKRDDTFKQWMISRTDGSSLWSDKVYRDALFIYLGRIYGKKDHIQSLFAQLEKENDKLDELDLLHTLFQRIEKERTVQKSCLQGYNSSRVDKRLNELKLFFNPKDACKSTIYDFKTLPFDLNKIDKNQIKAYFDLGCNTGVITAALGAYLGLKKENIFGGDVYPVENDHVTFIPMHESEGIINLPDDRVDLVTCLVTLHHITHIDSILVELARIIRPGGYLILREHDCRMERSLLVKYLNFIHAIRMYPFNGAFFDCSGNHHDQRHCELDVNKISETHAWHQKKADILDHTKSIRYHTRDEWKDHLKRAGFGLHGTLEVDTTKCLNPQNVFYALYQKEHN